MDIEKALEKQNSKEPIKNYKIGNEIYAECPSCGHTGLKQSTHEYCWWCGQKLNWIKSIEKFELKKNFVLILKTQLEFLELEEFECMCEENVECGLCRQKKRLKHAIQKYQGAGE